MNKIGNVAHHKVITASHYQFFCILSSLALFWFWFSSIFFCSRFFSNKTKNLRRRKFKYVKQKTGLAKLIVLDDIKVYKNNCKYKK